MIEETDQRIEGLKGDQIEGSIEKPVKLHISKEESENIIPDKVLTETETQKKIRLQNEYADKVKKDKEDEHKKKVQEKLIEEHRLRQIREMDKESEYLEALNRLRANREIAYGKENEYKAIRREFLGVILKELDLLHKENDLVTKFQL